MNISLPFTINIESLKEDLRKIGIGLLLAGMIHMALNESDMKRGLIVLVIGYIMWAIGLISPTQQEDEQ